MTTTLNSKSDTFPMLSQVVMGSAILVSVLQASFFAIEGGWTTYAIIAMGVAAMNLFFAARFLATKSGGLFGLALILYCAQLGIFIVNLIDQEPPCPLRLLQVAIVVSYFATVLLALLAGGRILAPVNAILLMCSVAIGICISEITLGFLAVPVINVYTGPQWNYEGNPELHPSLGVVYRPYSALKIYYPDNPRGYFEKEEPGFKREWQFNATAGNIADLVFPPDHPDTVRIAIAKVETKTEYEIQLNRPFLKVQQSHPYQVNFHARADSPRNIVVGFARAHQPWSGLGLWNRIALTTEWKNFQEQFVASADDDNARIYFDVGGSNISVEVSSVSLMRLPEGRSIEPAPPPRYFVSYQFNALGCRGRDYTIPRPSGTTRILCLGDSVTMGVGVHEEDTFSRQLEHLLDEEERPACDGGRYEVINCGASGYGTKEERLFYQLFGTKYEPNIVLLIMMWNDDMSYLEEIQRGYVKRTPGKIEWLFYSWNKIQVLRHRHPTPDFTKNVDEILRLDSEVRKRGARLAVIIPRNAIDFPDEADGGVIWNRLTDTITRGLQGTDIPILDLGKALLEFHPTKDLAVHQIDRHPNEIAHAIAAREIRDFLQKKGMLRP